MFFIIIVLCHVIGTLYYFLAQIEIYYGVENTWIEEIGKRDESWDVKYVEAFYWALATFLLVGSKGYTNIETMFCIAVLLFTIALFAYVISVIS